MPIAGRSALVRLRVDGVGHVGDLHAHGLRISGVGDEVIEDRAVDRGGHLGVEIGRWQLGHGVRAASVGAEPRHEEIVILLVVARDAHLVFGAHVPLLEVVVRDRPIAPEPVQGLHAEVLREHAQVDTLPMPRRSPDEPLVIALGVDGIRLRREHPVPAKRRVRRLGR